MTTAQQYAENLRELGFSTDSIALNLGITNRKLAELERVPVAAPVAVQAEVRHGVCRCGGVLV